MKRREELRRKKSTHFVCPSKQTLRRRRSLQYDRSYPHRGAHPLRGAEEGVSPQLNPLRGDNLSEEQVDCCGDYSPPSISISSIISRGGFPLRGADGLSMEEDEIGFL